MGKVRAATVLRTLLVTLIIGPSFGCHRVDYRGDGTMPRKRAPAWFCEDEFDIALGPLDLSKPVHVSRVLDGLPAGEYTFGFDIRRSAPRAGLPGNVVDVRPLNPSVTLTMSNEHNETVISTSGPLAKWTWSGAVSAVDEAYVYRRGESTEVSTGHATTQSRRDGVGADGGWGTYFTARPAGRYMLVLDIAEPVADAEGFALELEVRRVVGCL